MRGLLRTKTPVAIAACSRHGDRAAGFSLESMSVAQPQVASSKWPSEVAQPMSANTAPEGSGAGRTGRTTQAELTDDERRTLELLRDGLRDAGTVDALLEAGREALGRAGDPAELAERQLSRRRHWRRRATTRARRRP